MKSSFPETLLFVLLFMIALKASPRVRQRTVLILGVALISLGIAGNPQRVNSKFLSLQKANLPELILQRGHSLGVNCAAFAPDGSWLASGSADNSIAIWETSSGRQLRTLNGHTGYVRSVAISLDGRLLASGSNDQTVRVWDASLGRETLTLKGHSGPVITVAFSPDGQKLVSGSADKTIKIWDLTTGKEIRTLNKHTNPVSFLTFSKSGAALVSASDSEVINWDTQKWTDSRTFKRNTNAASVVAISESENLIASAALDGNILLWRLEDDHERFVLKKNSRAVLAMKFSAGMLSAIHADGGIDVWNIDNGRAVRSIPGGSTSEQLLSSSFSLDGTVFVAGNGSRVANIHKADSGEIIRSLETHSSGVNAITMSDDGRWFAAAADDASIRLWQVATGRPVSRLLGHAGFVTSIVFSSDNSILASGSRSGEVKLWDVTTSRLLNSLPSHVGGINALVFGSHNETLVVVGLDNKVELWDLSQKRSVFLSAHTQEITSVVICTDKNFFVTAGRDKTIRLWNLNSGNIAKVITTASEINGLALNTDGTVLATANADNTVSLWDIGSGVAVQTLRGHTAEVLSVRFSPDGKSLISGSADHSAIMWDTQSGKSAHVLRANVASVSSVTFTRDGALILSGSTDGSIEVWDSHSGTLLATLISVPNSDDWLVATPDGLFDGSPAAWDLMLWRFDQRTFNVLPVEAYFNEFFYPGVLAEIFGGENPKPNEDIVSKDRRQPSIGLAFQGDSGTRNVDLDLTVSEAASDSDHPTGSGAKDVRLFRNGLLVKTWAGDVLRSSKSVMLRANVPIVAGVNKFTAYAFNNDNIKSANSSLVVTGAETLKRQGTAYLLLIGVDQYENANYNLRYSSADVSEMESLLKDQQEKLGTYKPVVTIPLIDKAATKSNILLALQRIAGTRTGPLPANAPAILDSIKQAQPEDAVFIYFSGHGVSASNRFYLIPHDLGYDGPRNKLDVAGLKKILDHGISDEELEDALRPLDADQLLLVIDACYSGQAIESKEKRRGPMNTKGLAQLAYEKGIYVLTASQNIEVAFEAEVFKHSYLAYALLDEGLKNGAADTDHDGNIFLKEWFEYANSRVPQLRKLRFIRKELVEDEADDQKVQRPRVFYTREEGAKSFLIGRTHAN